MAETEKRKRGRPKGTKQAKTPKVKAHITYPKNADGTRMYAYKFSSSKCNCVFESDFRGAMWCIHKHLMDIITETQTADSIV